PVGETTVTCTAEDTAGNKSTATFKVTVTEKAAEDKTPPVIKVPADMTVSATGPGGAMVSYEGTATDPHDAVASLKCTPATASPFPLGETTVECTAEDTHKNVSHASFKVTVKDTVPPVISEVPANVSTEATSPAGAIVTYMAPRASDDVDGPVAVKCS